MPPQVFIGASSKDYELAQQVYEFLTGHGIEVFFSRESLLKLGKSDYGAAIDAALDEAMHMVVVTSSADNVRSTWLAAEWRMFVNEVRSGRKEGNLITVVAGTMTQGELPLTLRNYHIIPFAQLEQMLHYVGGSRRPVKAAEAATVESIQRPAQARVERQSETRHEFKVADLHLPNEPLLGFVEMPAGPFLMGSDKTKEKAAADDEMPQHIVQLSTFYMARNPVTVAQFKVFAEAASIRLDDGLNGEPNREVVNVSWNEALESQSPTVLARSRK